MQDQFCYRRRLIYRTIPPLKAAWNDRIQSTLSNANKLKTFALARAYIIAQNATWDDKNNITENKTGLGDFDKNILRGFEDQELLYVFEWDKKLAVQLTAFYAGSFKSQMEQAFGRLTQDEKADLEMLCFQEANGSARSIVNALSRETSKLELEHARGLLSNSKATLDGIVTGSLALAATFWWNPYISVPALASAAVHAIWSGSNNATLKKVNEKIASKNSYVDTEKRTATTLAANVTNARSTLAGACQALATLKGANSGGSVSWDDVSKALVSSKKFSAAELATMKTLYEGYKAKNGDKAASAQDMIGLIATWSSARYNEAADSFASRRQALAEERSAAESSYKAVYDQYLAGTATEADLKSAAQAAFGKDTMSDKAYFIDMRDFYNNNVFTAGIDYTGDSLQTAASYTGLVQQLAGMRYNMEIAAREAEWNIAVKDLESKRQTWNDAARRILEAGLADFDKGYAKIKTEWTTWQDKYKEEYERLATAWDTSYAEMEGKKLAWVGRATKAAESAADSVTLALLGDDAETEARRLDTDIVAELSLGNNAKGLLEQALASASIVNMEKALTASAGSAATVAQAVQTGLGGPAAWNSATISLAAEAFARESNKELAARQAKLMAARLRDQVALMTKGVETSVKDANENTEAGMDSTYLGQGMWSISGGYYVKDVVVHSTVANKYITERASVERFRAYEAPPVAIKTDISDTTLETLQADAIQQLMENVQKEITDLMEDIFGHRDEDGELKDGEVETIREFAQNPIWEDYEAFEDQWVESRDEEGVIEHIQVRVPVLSKRITGYTQGEELWKQEIGAGFFGKYLGAAPITKTKDANLEQGYAGIFEARTLDGNKPKGEIGRLMAEYIYWSMKEGQGYALAAAPVYDKPLWDSRGSFFQAPSIRDIADIGVTIAATAITAPMGGIGGALISAGINLADDALFATLDVAGSYKSLGEAGLEFGKKVLSSAVNVGAQGLFGGFAGKMVDGKELTTGIFGASKGIFSNIKTDTLSGVIGKTLATGLQTVTTSVATSAINAFNIQYDEYGNALGLGWSNDAFSAGVQGGLISAATSMTSTFTSGALNLGLEGFFGEVYGNGVALSKTLGSLAAQGMNYALTGSASFNLLNFSMFGLKDSVGGTIGGGLLELNVGRNGIASRLGMGGADVSMGTVLKSLKGLEAWGVNLTMLTSGQEEAKKYASALRTLYSAGLDAKGNKTKEFSLFEEILAGKTNVVEDPNAEYNAETTLDETTGIKTITLGKQALENGARFGLNILLGHEAYRNGINDGKQGQRIETNDAVIGHINIAARLGMTYGMDNLSDNDRTEIDALQKAAKGDTAAIAKILGGYDASGDFWKLTANGSLEYDGKANLYDEKGNLIRKVVDNERMVEGGLIRILGLDPNNPEHVSAVIAMMKSSGLQQDSDGYWNRKKEVEDKIYVGTSVIKVKREIDFNSNNMGKNISLDAVSNLFHDLKSEQSVYRDFIENNYMYAGEYLRRIASDKTLGKGEKNIYDKAYSREERGMIAYNLLSKLDYTKMIPGSTVTQDFENNLIDYLVNNGTAKFSELHSGIDLQKVGADKIYTPDGYWMVRGNKDGKLVLEQLGTGIRMRIMHCAKTDVDAIALGTTFGPGDAVINYPGAQYGTSGGANPHIHTEFTGVLNWQRKFMNPVTWQFGNYNSYTFSYKNLQGQVTSSGSMSTTW